MNDCTLEHDAGVRLEAVSVQPVSKVFSAPGDADWPRGVVTFLFTDIESHAALWNEFESEMRGVILRHFEALGRIVGEHGGVVFKTMGDQVCAAFSSPARALEAGVAMQRLLAEPDPDLKRALRTRIALHTGHAELVDEDYFGRSLTRVARLLSAGHGGQLLLSQVTCEMVRDDLPRGVTLRDLGVHRLRDLVGSEHLFEVCIAGLEAAAPARALRTLEARATNLPAQLTAFFGREREMTEVCAGLERDRLLTLWGPGGVGKTRLAIQTAARIITRFEGGVWLVELSRVPADGDVGAAVASALGVAGGAGADLRGLRDAIGPKDMLLVLDNCEHVVGGVQRLARVLLESCANVRIVCTSREALGLGALGERTHAVQPLALAATDLAQALRASDAGALFEDRARLSSPGFRIDAGNAGLVGEACKALEGLPLAIELAAARVGTLGLEGLVERLRGGVLDALRSQDRSRSERERTLRASVRWSYALLTREQQALARRLSVCEGGWTLALAQRVAGTGDLALHPRAGERTERAPTWAAPCDLLPEAHIVDVLDELVRASIVQAEGSGGTSLAASGSPATGAGGAATPTPGTGLMRYRFLGPVLEFVREEAGSAPHTEERRIARTRHALAMALACDECERAGGTPGGEALSRALWRDLANVRTAVETSLDDAARVDVAARLAVSAAPEMYTRGARDEGEMWIKEVLERRGAHKDWLQARAANWAGAFAWARGALGEARAAYERSIALWEQLGRSSPRGDRSAVGRTGFDRTGFDRTGFDRTPSDRTPLAGTLSNLGALLTDAGDAEQALHLHDQAHEIYVRARDAMGAAKVSLNRSQTLAALHRWDEMHRVLDECIPVFEGRDDFRYAVATSNRAEASLRAGHPGDALDDLRRSLPVRLRVAGESGLGRGLVLAAAALCELGRCELGSEFLGKARALRARYGGGPASTDLDPEVVRQSLAARSGGRLVEEWMKRGGEQAVADMLLKLAGPG